MDDQQRKEIIFVENHGLASATNRDRRGPSHVACELCRMRKVRYLTALHDRPDSRILTINRLQSSDVVASLPAATDAKPPGPCVYTPLRWRGSRIERDEERSLGSTVAAE
jgi:hypothetical protein